MSSGLTTNVALLASVQAKSEEKRDQIINNLRHLDNFFRLSSTQCITRSNFTPVTQKGAASALIGRLEIFSSEADLAAAQASQEYKCYYDSLRNEHLCESEENITFWQVAGGFLSRRGENQPPKAGLLVLAKFLCIQGEEAVQRLLEELQKYCNWVEANEPSTYTYCVLTSQMATKEVLLFERYQSLPAMKDHSRTQEFRTMFKQISPFIEPKRTEISQWIELDGSFVSTMDVEAKVKL